MSISLVRIAISAAVVIALLSAAVGCRGGNSAGRPGDAPTPSAGAVASSMAAPSRMFTGDVVGDHTFTARIGDPLVEAGKLESSYPHPSACTYAATKDVLVPIYFSVEAFTDNSVADMSVSFGVHLEGPNGLVVATASGRDKQESCLAPATGERGVDIRIRYGVPLKLMAIYEYRVIVIIRGMSHSPDAYRPILRDTLLTPLTIPATSGMRGFALKNCRPNECSAGIGLAD